MPDSMGEMTVKVDLIKMGWICPICNCGVNPHARRCKCMEKVAETAFSAVRKFNRKFPYVEEEISEEQLMKEVKENIEKYGMSEEQLKTEAIVKEAAEKIKERAKNIVIETKTVGEEDKPTFSDFTPTEKDFPVKGYGKVLKPESDQEEVPYGTEYKIKKGENAGLHGAYIRQEMGERGILKVITLFKNSVQVKMYDDQIERVEEGIGEWSVTGK